MPDFLRVLDTPSTAMSTFDPRLAALRRRLAEIHDDDLGGLLTRGAPRVRLVEPTPVEPGPFIESLLAQITGRERSRAPTRDAGARMWIKRDDRSCVPYGGSKPRKLEWVLADPAVVEAGRLASVGAVGSHHLLALAFCAAARGVDLDALVCPQPRSQHALDNLLTLASLGATLHPFPARIFLPLARARLWWRQRAQAPSRWIPAGASTPRSALGFVAGALELRAQIDAGELPRPSRIYVPGGTLGCAAGLILGCVLARVETHVRVVAVVERVACNRWMMLRALSRAAAFMRELGAPVPSGDLSRWIARGGVRWSLATDDIGLGYAHSTAEAKAAVDGAREAGLSLETTYTGKCLAALVRDLARVARAELDAGAPWLWWNTHAGTLDPEWIAADARARVPASLLRGME